MGMTHQEYLSSTRVWGCKSCKTHLSPNEALISRVSQNFNGQTGRAFLFGHVVNIVLGVPEDRHMTTGLHTVRDIRCAKCNHTLGWKYDRAFVTSEKYKEGKFILERNLMEEVE